MSLKTDYKDYIPATTLRKYQQVDNGDGTVSFQDVTDYTQVGNKFGANEANGIGTEVNAIADSAVQSATLGGVAVPKNGTTLQLPAYPTSLPNPNALTFTGGTALSYDGSAPKSVAIPTALPAPNALNVSVGIGGNTGSYTGAATLAISIPKLTLSTTATPAYTLATGELYLSST